MNQYVVFYQHYGEIEVRHYSFEIEVIGHPGLSIMDEIYGILRDYVGHVNRFTILSITKLN
jgi:hypothetical protein